MAYTDRSKAHFRSVDESDGSFWIICEPQGAEEGTLAERFIGLHFRHKVSMQEADSIAAMLREKFDVVSITTLEPKDGAKEVLSDRR